MLQNLTLPENRARSTQDHHLNKLEFMFMKHYAPSRCEPSIKALNFFFFFLGGGGGGGGLVRVDVNGEVKFL